MKVGLIDYGGSLPNLALMHLSAWHKALGDEVVLEPLPLDGCDRLYMSTLFTWNRPRVEAEAARFRAHADVRVGGPGMLPDQTALPPAVEAMPSDYTLFGIDYGMGYSSRGCVRHCAHCSVPKLEGDLREASGIAQLLNPRSNRLLLLDNNFGASDWKPKIAEIRERGLHVSWPQGLDIRLLDADFAQALADLHRRGQLWNQRFTKRGQLHFAWDLPSTEATAADVLRGVQLLFDVGFVPDDLIFYVLIGYWWRDSRGVRHQYSVPEELERIGTLHSLGIHPFVQPYRSFDDHAPRDQVRMDIARWNNRHLWRTVPFSDYRREVRLHPRGPARRSADESPVLV